MMDTDRNNETHRELVPPEADGRLCPPRSNMKSILRRSSHSESVSPSKKVKWTKEVDKQFKTKVKLQKTAQKKREELAKKKQDRFTVSNWTLRLNNAKL